MRRDSFVAFAIATALAACDQAQELGTNELYRDGQDAAGGGGRDGDGNGGQAGKAGSGGSAGATGASGGNHAGSGGTAGQAGSGSDASAGGTAGSGGGDAGAGGMAGTAGVGGQAGAGASLGQGGLGSGGSGLAGQGGGESKGGAGGGGGAAGSEPMSSRCQALCTTLVAAGCTNSPTMEGCLLTCQALTSSASCDGPAKSYFDCAAGTTIQCNGAGDPVAPGCGLAWVQAISCATTASPNPAIEAPCDTNCDKVVGSGCPKNGPKDECMSNCRWSGATGTGCDDEWGAYLDCANGVQMVCLLGYAVAPGCGPAFTAYTTCINQVGK